MSNEINSSSIESKENNDIEIELGQIIKLMSPDNNDLNNKIYYIKYLDDKKIKLFDPYTNTLKILNLENGKFTDESIIGIEVLYIPEKKGYARQNGLLPGVGITIEFGGDVPQIVNGEITNLEEDMIELKMVGTNEKIYLDFKYHGLPEEYKIVEIKPFNLNYKTPQERSQPGEDASKEVEKQDESLNVFDEEYLDEDEEEEILFNYDEEINKQENLEILNQGLNIIDIGEEIDVEIEFLASEQNKRFSLTKQIDSMLDDLLSRIPTNERSKDKINEINKNIIRFKELRKLFSNFKEDGNIENPKYKYFNKDYKSLVQQLHKLNQKLLWLVPIVGTRKKIYDIDLMEMNNRDFIVDTTDNYIKSYMNIMETYRDNVTNVDDKYIYLEQNLNNLQKNNINLEDKEGVIKRLNVIRDIECFVENFDNIASSAYKDETIDTVYNDKQIFIEGRDIYIKDPITKVESKLNIIEPEKLYLKGFVVRSDNYKKYNDLLLSEKSIYSKANINNFLTYKSIPSNFDFENIIIDDNFEKHELEINNTAPYKITFNSVVNFDDRDNDDVYDRFLNSIIPSNTEFIKKIYKSNNSMSIYDFVNKLETFHIYQNDIHFEQLKLIDSLVDRNIVNMKKILAKRESEYLNTTSSERNELKLLNRIFTKDDTSLIKEITDNYEISNKLSNTEIIKKIISEDGGKNIVLLMSKVMQPLSQNINYDQRIEEELTKLDDIEEKQEGLGDCEQVIITKKYNSLDDLKRDNNKEDVLYDREYDNTRYDIMEEFEVDRNILKPEVLERKIVDHLINVVGVNENDAIRDAQSMINGRKMVINGEYAILDLGEYEYRYYERKENNWRLNEEYNDKMPDDALFCNLKQKCLAINDKCSPIEKHTVNIEKDILNKIADHFSEELVTLQERKKTKIAKLYNDSVIELNQIVRFNKKQKHVKDSYMNKIADTLEDIEVKISPYFELRDDILSQNDIIKKFSDISIFIDKYCRRNEKLNSEENVYWYYCIETNAPLLPTFFYDLAMGMERNEYEITLEKIVKNRGKLSDDGDKIVDKYSGYLIKILNFDNDEGYDKSGYKIVTREVIEEDAVDKMTSVLENKDNRKTSLSNFLEKMFISMSKNMGINISEEMEFMMSATINLIENNIKNKKDYNEIITKKSKKTSRAMKSYEEYYDQLFILCVVSIYIITIQSVIPRIKSSKTIPGCIVSFSGYPLEDETSNKNIINYVICSILKYKNDSRPWKNGLPRIRNLSSNTRDVQKLENYYKKVKNFIATKVIVIPELESKLVRKRKWIKENKEIQKTSNLTFSLRRWTTFSPPLYKIQNINDKSYNLKNTMALLKKAITQGNKAQHNIENLLIGKSKNLSIKILEIINKIVTKKELLFITNSGIPYLENACCNDDSGNAYDYFIKNESGTKLNKFNQDIKAIREILERTQEISKSNYLFTNENTKQQHIKVDDKISEETIYKAFIKYCKYNTGLELDTELSAICENNTASFNKFDTIEEKINILKTENGTLYNTLSLMNLMNVINKRNRVELNLSNDIFSSNVIFNQVLQNIVDGEESLYDKDLLNEVLNYSKKFSDQKYIQNRKEEKKASSKEENVSDFINLINNKIIDYKEKIIDFLRLSNVSSSSIRKINSFIDKMEKYSINEQDIYMSNKDAKNYFIGEYFKINIKNITKLLPEIVINQVDYTNKYVPKHWKLGSQYHIKDIKDIIKDEFKGFQKFYGNDVFSKILDNIFDKSFMLSELSTFVPFISSNVETSMFSTDIYRLVLKMILLQVLILHIDITNVIDMQGNIELRERVVELSELDQAKKEANIQTIKSKMSNYLVSIFNYLMKKKKIMNINKEKIKKNVLKSKVKEKNIITERLRAMTVEQRQIENLKKNHKLGDWNVGQTRAIFEYDENQYDKERSEMEKRYDMELRLGITDDVSMEQRDIYMMDYIEQDAIASRIEKDELGLDMRHEGDRDGEEEW